MNRAKVLRIPYSKPSATPRFLLMCQAIDHLPVLLLCLLYLSEAFSLFSGHALSSISKMGPTFWIGTLLLWFFVGFIYRFFSLVYFGKTFGQYFLGLRYKNNDINLASIIGLALESLQICFPPLWVLDYLSRLSKTPINPDYVFCYDKDS